MVVLSGWRFAEKSSAVAFVAGLFGCEMPEARNCSAAGFSMREGTTP